MENKETIVNEVKRMSLYAKIQKARAMLQKRDITKSGENTFSKYKYFELSDFLPHINEIFDELGLFSTTFINEKIGILTIFDSDNEEKYIQFKMPSAKMELKGGNLIQNIGAVQTYVRRYLFMSALEISESDLVDFNKDGSSGTDEPKKPKKPKNETSTKDSELDELLNKVLAKKEDLKKIGKMAEANKIILEKSATPNPKGIKNKEDLQFVLDKLNEIK